MKSALRAADPNAVHFCWTVEVEAHGYKWFKHWFEHFNFAACPPWPEFHNKHRRGLFPHPPRPALLTSQARRCRSPDVTGLSFACSHSDQTEWVLLALARV